MPWQLRERTNARAHFINDWLKSPQQCFAALCHRHGISRVCGYKWRTRFAQGGQRDLFERRRKTRSSERLKERWLARLKAAMLQERDFGPKKLHWKLCEDYSARGMPSLRTLCRWLETMGRVRKARVQHARRGPPLRIAGRLSGRCANDVWTIDFKGEFRTGDGQRVMALTVRDLASRFILCVQHVRSCDERTVGRVLRRLFRKYGLPRAIRMDNGTPFGRPGPRGWSKLSLQWIKLGIRTEFGRPAHPEDNPGHEQMHRVLKYATANPPAPNLCAQQLRFDRWRKRYNQRRPHESLSMTRPHSRYRASIRRLPKSTIPWRYPANWLLLRADAKGRCTWQRRQRLIGQAFAREIVGAKPIASGIAAIYYRQYLIGTLHAADLAGLRHVRLRQVPKPEREGLRPSLRPPQSK